MVRQIPLCAALAILTLAACDGPTVPRPLDVRLVDLRAWSGGEALLVSGAFAPPRAVLVRSDTATLTVRRIDDSTIAVRLPDGNGPRPLTVEVSGYAPFADTVILHGFRDSEDGPFLSGFLQVVPGHPWVLGASDPGLAEVDVRTGDVLRSWPDTVHSPDCTWGVGPSVRSGHYVVFGKGAGGDCTHPWVWQYGTTLVRVDSVWGSPDTWSIAEIGPGGSIAGSDDHVSISHCDSLGCSDVFYGNRGGSLTGVTVGPVARRAVLHNFYGLTVDAATGDTLYRLPLWEFGHTEGVAFSAAEDTLYAVITGFGGSPPGAVLVMAGSANGILLDSVSLSGVWAAYDVARDPERAWLYVAAFEGSHVTNVVPVILILDQHTLATVAALRAPAAQALSLTAWHQFRLVPDPAQSAVYVVATVQAYDLHGLRSRILRFAVIP